MLTIILCLFPFAMFGAMIIDFYLLDSKEKKNK